MKIKRKKPKKSELRMNDESVHYSIFDDPSYDYDHEDIEELKFKHTQRRIDALFLA